MPTDFNLNVSKIENTLQHHLPAKHPDGWVLCGCGETYEGPVYHRRHVASLIASGDKCEPGCKHPEHTSDTKGT